MKICFNVRKIYENVMSYVEDLLGQLFNILNIHETRIQYIEASEWVKLNSGSGNIEINQEFTEIKMIASVYDSSNIEYSFNCNYDTNIFHNSINGRDVYFITGNPIANNYGCKFKYTVSENGKQYISVDSCYNGNNTVDCVLDVWIKTVPTEPQ